LYMEELESEINQASGLLGAMRNEINWQDVKGGLQEGEAAVEIVRVRKFDMGNTATKYNFTDSVEYAVLFIDKSSTGPQCFAIENGNDLEDRYLPYYRNSIQTKQPDTISYNRFWRPLKKHLGKYKRLFISCDGVYNQLNLHTLYNPASNLYLLDETNIVLVTNTKDILTPSLPFRVGRGSFFGRPNYKLNVPMPVATNLAVNRSMDDEAMENLRDHEFDDLPQTEEEIAAIGSLLLQYQWKFQSNTGDLATEANLKSVYNPTVLHLATHGFFLQSDLPNSNSMVRSGIVLSGINNVEQSEEDGVLTALESTSLHLDSTYLVVLSACETGLGTVKNGEGVYGLQRGFIVAGARHLLMSLWKVDDLATRILMEEFYKAWLGTGDLHHAMKSAQLALRKDYPHPYYWGAFVLFGN
jgi:CHAT domain-containing protein